MAQPPPQYSYAPPPNELPYYNALFTAADHQSTGYLSGPSAVEFLSLSKLPVDLLKQIWTMADQPASNTLDAPKFYVAVRLIQLFQNGKKPVDLALNLGEGEVVRAPHFEGVNVQQAMAQQQQQQHQQQPPQQQMQQQHPPQQQMGQQQQQQPSPQMQPAAHPQPQPSPQRSPPMGAQPTMMNGGGAPPPLNSTTLAVQDPYIMTPQELSRYEDLFPTYAQPDPAEGGKMYVGGAAAVELFSKSGEYIFNTHIFPCALTPLFHTGMGRDSLKIIWTMVDDPIDNKLDSIEFAIAMHLIVCVTKKGLPIPGSGLPGSLRAVAAQARQQQGQQQPSPQMQPQGMPQGGGMGGGQSVAGSVMPPPIPSPDKRPSMGMMQQQPQMNGGMPPPQQMGQPQMTMQQQPPQPQMQPQIGGAQQPGMDQMQQQTLGIQQTGSFGGTTVGGHTVDDAFAGLSNDPVESVDEYSTIGGMDGSEAAGGVMGSGMSTIGMTGLAGLGQQQQQYQQPTVQEVATPEPSPQPVVSAVQARSVMPPPPIQQQQQQQQQYQQQPVQQQQQQQQHHALPPRSPRPPPKAAAIKSTMPASTESTAELESLREAHQKLQAEVISLRAKAASVSEEEQETQKEIAVLASEIGKLSLELSELKEGVMEAKVKLAESVGVLKVQMEEKGSLEAQVTVARETHEALTSAHEAVTEASELAMAQQAKAVAAAAVAREEEAELSVIPPPEPAPVVETADLFSWEAPAPAAPVPAVQEAVNNPMSMMSSPWGADAPSVHSSSNPNMMGGGGGQQELAPHQGSVDSQQEQQPAWVSSDNASVAHSVQSNHGAAAAPPTPQKEEHQDHFSVYTTTTGTMSNNPNPYGGFQGMGMGAPVAPMMGGGGGDLFGGAMGGAPPAAPQPVMAPMGGPDPQQHHLTPPVTPQRNTAYDEQIAAAASHEQPPPPASKSPTKAELDALKSKTDKAEKDFQSSISLVRSISVEVNQLESAAKKAESEMKTLEGKKKKGSFVGGKKKAKKEYEKAMGVAHQELNKVKEAKAQLAAAERESENAKREMEEYRQKYEQLELEAATAASYISVQQQQQQQGGHQRSDSQSAGGHSAAAGGMPPANQYADPFGTMNQNYHASAPAATASSDPYGMGLMGGAPGGDGGDYANPFAM
ncbi:hypothetical protein ACHAXR_011738 [Thalassiosira sp. AJA248-18]